ncbi:MAG: hypothetical protein LC123_02425 [Burkholderiales bacterium]|nr:hypothetical protein [Burkholderiales bacterium]
MNRTIKIKFSSKGTSISVNGAIKPEDYHQALADAAELLAPYCPHDEDEGGGPDRPPEPEPDPPPGTRRVAPKGGSCCALRTKIVVGVVGTIPEEACGVPDSALADVLRWDETSTHGRPILAFRFCPWCGARRVEGTNERVVEPRPVEQDDPSPDWSGDEEES